MTKIGLMSDTHSYLDEQLFKTFEDRDEIWHAGDFGNIGVADKLASFKPLKGVYGNIDEHEVRQVYPLNNHFTCEKMNVWMTHIGGYPGKYNPKIREDLKLSPPDLFICGHSHILKVIYDKQLKLLHINPGAYGKEGFHKLRTLIKFSIDGREMKDLQVVEFARK